MINTIFHSSKFDFKGIQIPEFSLEPGKLVRLCLPNFDSEGNDLVRDFRYDLLKHLEIIIPESKWSKEYSSNWILKFFKPATVGNFIIKKSNVDIISAQQIAKKLELEITRRIDKLTTGELKALAIICDFEKYKTLIFDYYGVGAKDFIYLEKVVHAEIEKGKCGIVLDRHEYNLKEETDKNINRVEITVGNNVYKPLQKKTRNHQAQL